MEKGFSEEKGLGTPRVETSGKSKGVDREVDIGRNQGCRLRRLHNGHSTAQNKQEIEKPLTL